MYRASAAWEDLVYNFARPLETLRVKILGDPKRRWRPRTPAMAAGLTDRIWTVIELRVDNKTFRPAIRRVFEAKCSAIYTNLNNANSCAYLPNKLTAAMTGANKDDTRDITVISVLSDGPAVSLKGSPTVSPTTPALCESEPLPPKA